MTARFLVHGYGLGSLRRSHDALLSAVGPGKVLALGEIWNGVERSRDMLVEESRKLDTPLVPPRILTAERVPAELDLGTVHDGLDALERFAGEIEDAKRRQPRRSADSGIMPAAVQGGFSKPITAQEVQAGNEAFWRERNETGSCASRPNGSNAPAPSSKSRIASIQEANDQFWAQRYARRT